MSLIVVNPKTLHPAQVTGSPYVPYSQKDADSYVAALIADGHEAEAVDSMDAAPEGWRPWTGAVPPGLPLQGITVHLMREPNAVLILPKAK